MEGKAAKQQLSNKHFTSVMFFDHCSLPVAGLCNVHRHEPFIDIKTPKFLVNNIFLFTRGAQYVYR